MNSYNYRVQYITPEWRDEFFSLRCRGEFLLALMFAPIFAALVRWGIGL